MGSHVITKQADRNRVIVFIYSYADLSCLLQVYIPNGRELDCLELIQVVIKGPDPGPDPETDQRVGS